MLGIAVDGRWTHGCDGWMHEHIDVDRSGQREQLNSGGKEFQSSQGGYYSFGRCHCATDADWTCPNRRGRQRCCCLFFGERFCFYQVMDEGSSIHHPSLQPRTNTACILLLDSVSWPRLTTPLADSLSRFPFEGT